MSFVDDAREWLADRLIGEDAAESKKIYKAFEKIKDPHEKNPDKMDYEKVGVSEYEMVQQSQYYYDAIYYQASDKEKMMKEYREMANFPEVADALDDICDEAIVQDEEGEVMHMQINSERILSNENMMKNIQSEYNHIVEILDFHNNCFNLFRRFYVEAEIFAEMVINPDKPEQGVKKVVMLPTETMFIDYDNFEQIKGFRQKIDLNDERVKAQTGKDKGLIKFKNTQVAYANSGIFTKNQVDEKIVLSYIERAKVAYRQLKWMEDSLVIYRIVRSPERRIFYIDVGNLPKKKAEEYMQELIRRYKQRKIYNPATGEIDVGRNVLAMTEDFWLPMRGGQGPKVDNLPGGANLGEIGDVIYFVKKLYKALKVPTKRIDEENPQMYVFSGREQMDTRNEIKFAKYVQRVRSRFIQWFIQIFQTHLKLKGLWDKYDLEDVDFHFIFNEENEWREGKMLYNWNTRLETYARMLEHEGKDFSRTWLKKTILKMSDEEIQENDDAILEDVKNQIDREKKLNNIRKKMGAPQVPLGTGDSDIDDDEDGKKKKPGEKSGISPEIDKETGAYKPAHPPKPPSPPKVAQPKTSYNQIYGKPKKPMKEKQLLMSSEEIQEPTIDEDNGE